MDLSGTTTSNLTTSTSRMKLHIAFILVFAALATAKFQIRTKDDALQAHEECRETNNVPDDIYEEFLVYKFPEHKRTNCYVKCFVEKMGLFTELKGFDEKAIISQFTHKNTKDLEKVRHGLEKCIDHNEWDTDTCTWTNRVFSCWLKVTRPIVVKTYGD